MSVSKLVTLIKSLTARELFKRHPEIKQMLWGGNFWTSGYYANTVGQYGNMDVIRKYIENQGKENEYKKPVVSGKNQRGTRRYPVNSYF